MGSGGSAGANSPPRDVLCAPCTSNADCSGETCVVNNDTGERFCARSCGASHPCPDNFECLELTNRDESQCAPVGGSCIGMTPLPPAGTGGAAGVGGAAGKSGGAGGAPANMNPPSTGCDPAFLGPFCENDQIIGFVEPEMPATPTLADMRRYSLAALNQIRSRTCLPALAADDCLDRIAATALEMTPLSHTYFAQNCLGKASCECNWTQENIGASAGTGRTWRTGVQRPLCSMMEEGKGEGHRGNIESKQWTRVGIGISWTSSGASWHHEFGK